MTIKTPIHEQWLTHLQGGERGETCRAKYTLGEEEKEPRKESRHEEPEEEIVGLPTRASRTEVG